MAFPSGLVELIDILSQHGVEQAVICPGSRNAPIMLAISRNTAIQSFSISDERSAGFFALGLALHSKKPVILCCTSGSAALNMAPAVAEAYFQEVSLIVLTADRPQEWIGQWDGQTIYQERIFGAHAKQYFSYSTQAHESSDEIWHRNRIANDAFWSAFSAPQGPVQINIPIKEPFYPEKGAVLPDSKASRKIQKWITPKSLDVATKTFIQRQISVSSKIVITVGQFPLNTAIQAAIATLMKKGIPVLADSIANLSGLAFDSHDLILANTQSWEALQPDLHIHLGKSFVTKRIKQFLRSNDKKQEWQVNPHPQALISDPFKGLQHVLEIDEVDFLNELSLLNFSEKQEAYFQTWKMADEIVATKRSTSINDWNELGIFQKIAQKLPSSNAEIHVANSLSVRYLNWINFVPKGIEVFSNRGTSGIDGCLSTAIGAAQDNSNLVISIIGDVAFHYDKNALWNSYVPNNVRIIVMNNHGGGIFRNLEGAKDLPELEGFMETQQVFHAENTAKDAGINYILVKNNHELLQSLDHFFQESDKAQLMEIETNSNLNAAALAKYMALFKG
ncbi:2-succinyl-5-enolpyruvyl-6-hydroxy-3-cyclohexene-1-carboxylic-acid synthase [Aquirufa aurantiipilula]|uniref:2-succinyl-5-enolpyruvyl-6-hydroxy-3-cyclohexene-1-carboxylate synthase n=1 Tax=Aquirufa aurantiipilula TaxID=2696561 RepID=A0ABT6BLD6_9BACT|nr:2-succinyl-5-enolpyruvyl-6-hydroxy-3-cyclohexene-1-carboxylic-acid synthase [Aquirufa aurantiipilula]MDF5691227.1 2-succinyl-5-enolpyruvyl-6-hydroxy-3-cyclohexene-1-carboxylic-acid synthase [Aquirufa aurantiipilula]